MKKQDTSAFSFSAPCPRSLPLDAMRASAFFLGLLALGVGLAGRWSGIGWLCALAGVLAACWQSLAAARLRGRYRLAAPLAVLLAAALCSRAVLAGLVTVSQHIAENLTAQTGHIVLPLAGSGGSALLFCLLSSLLLGLLCAGCVRRASPGFAGLFAGDVRRAPPLCAALLAVLTAALLLLLRPAPSDGGRENIWIIIELSAVVLLLFHSGKRIFSYLFVLFFLVLAGVLGLVIPENSMFSDWRAQSAAAVHNFRYEYGKNVLPEGKFEHFQEIDGQTPCLTLTMEQPEALYLRGFTGETFTGTGWLAAGEARGETAANGAANSEALRGETAANGAANGASQAEQSDLIYWLHKEGFYPQTQLAAAAHCLPEQPQTQTVTVDVTAACRAYLYVPYALAAVPAESSLTAASLETVTVPAKGLRGARSYRFTMLRDAQTVAQDALALLSAQPEQCASYLSQEGSYRSSTEAQDLSLSDAVREQLSLLLDPICQDFGSADTLTPEQAQLCALQFLEQLDALREANAALPLDSSVKDTTYQTATLTVLALRYYGIPARYAEGFVLSAEAASAAAPGKAITLTAADAQAWAEIYQDGIGWLPLELTPGYGELTDALSSQQLPSGQSDTAGETGKTGDADTLPEAARAEDEPDAQTQDTPQAEQPSGGETAAERTPRLWTWLPFAALLLLLLAGLIVRRALLCRRRAQRLHAEPPAQAIVWTARELGRLWPAMGEAYHGGSIFALSDALRNTDPEYADAVRTLAALNGEARFSSHPMTPEQAQQARAVWQATLLRVRAVCSPLRRFRLKWLRCLY